LYRNPLAGRLGALLDCVTTGGSLPKKHVATKQAPTPIGPYSQGVIAGGLLFVSGQIPIDPATDKLVEGDIKVQTEQVLKNILAVLKEAKMGPENVVKASVFLADLADFPQMNEVYGKYLGKEPPARSTIQAAGLPKGARIEIDVIAAF
jgi:2-iminobutanoate/2-iminopropanoate deaminase